MDFSSSRQNALASFRFSVFWPNADKQTSFVFSSSLKREISISTPYVHPQDGAKDVSCVGKVIASAIGGVSATRDDRIQREHVPTICPEFLEIRARQVVDSYRNEIPQELFEERKRTLVFSSVHRTGVYVAEALGALLLPLQFMAFAETLEQVLATKRHAGEDVEIRIGEDEPLPGVIWAWIRIVNRMPRPYQDLLEDAEKIVIVGSVTRRDLGIGDLNHDHYSAYVFDHRTGSVALACHSSLDSRWLNALPSVYGLIPISSLEQKQVAKKRLGQWEFAVTDEQKRLIESLSTGKELFDLRHEPRILYEAVWAFWIPFLRKNGKQPRRLALLDYWIAQPTLEFVYSAVPYPFYCTGLHAAMMDEDLLRPDSGCIDTAFGDQIHSNSPIRGIFAVGSLQKGNQSSLKIVCNKLIEESWVSRSVVMYMGRCEPPNDDVKGLCQYDLLRMNDHNMVEWRELPPSADGRKSFHYTCFALKQLQPEARRMYGVSDADANLENISRLNWSEFCEIGLEWKRRKSLFVSERQEI